VEKGMDTKEDIPDTSTVAAAVGKRHVLK